MYHALHENRVESRALQGNSCDNLNKGYCKLGQLKGDCSGRESVNSHAPPNTQYMAHETLNFSEEIIKYFELELELELDTGVCKARFQGAASPCSRRPIASFTLSGFTNPVRLHPVYPCSLGLSTFVLPAFHQCCGADSSLGGDLKFRASVTSIPSPCTLVPPQPYRSMVLFNR